ncbi:hypothetical protein ACFYRL_33045 [Streptomyces goshikiensis]|uniref:hypothetical protein n=1 Tax=Streptomyces goshikiensis TaxID=1942 RepID=UPI0036760199
MNEQEVGMALVIELRRGVSALRTGRKAGPSPATGMLERMVVDDEFWTALARLGRHRLPTLSDVDAYGDTTLRGEAVDRMVGELEGANLAQLNSAEHEAIATLWAWGLRCRADRDLRIAFSGD